MSGISVVFEVYYSDIDGASRVIYAYCRVRYIYWVLTSK